MKQLRTKFRTFTRFRFIYIAKHLSLIPGLVYTAHGKLCLPGAEYRLDSEADDIYVLVEKPLF